MIAQLTFSCWRFTKTPTKRHQIII
ncbi:hypothetical protein CP8484711_1807A, partial [Chlamydia psittaci 84-8471/1]